MNLVPVGSAGRGGLLLLAPGDAHIPEAFEGVEFNSQGHAIVLAEVQRLRGQTYVADGAIAPSELEPDGRYLQPVDDRAWHLVSLDGRGDVRGCARYLVHENRPRFHEIGVSKSALCQSAQWASYVQAAVDSEIALAGRLSVDFVEVGGWALTPELRCTTEALRIALGMFSMARILGGCIGLTTATRRHCSSSILRRIGGQSLMMNGIEIPRYFDPRYDCQMEILRFDSARPNPRYESWIEELKRHLSVVPVLQGAANDDLWIGQAPAMTAA